ncbi:tRNA (adenosine(37)-N6)-threonylcarbamoyltransferase complex dimerization subunit type 1 TsaB [Rudanella paleaurantiibacter]|uniref:N(6)-L-threonylcarbamoyladenine synthase n=1 Tax=Rudanella paleaurantiibacter TaxID=2614655 RepID=A0A7J5U4J6_9BACT|nr:tRNA (adenosine(37)-N6)-threonylcarbamoyltransferase complex dimerization subunit type 1 TsaB [Rudanella paleaurantiibacter]KAB7732685.1 tRNA (adenosine(37)-N6)-threonylcarbamoyltransferase complex dimerization subunit type 1 TsaB [Rudanella paleaurantiibacter]
MLLLSIDTSTTVCSVALHRAEAGATSATLLGAYELFTERTSSAMLTTLMGDVVRQAGFDLSDLSAIAVAKGPGSYTGLRIGVSTAKGLCFALDKPLLAVNTLRAMAEQVRRLMPLGEKAPLLCPMIDARRMEVYCALYDKAGREVKLTAAEIIDEQSFAEWLAEGPVVFFGDGAAKCRPVLGLHPNALFPDEPIRPSARTIGQLAFHQFEAGRFEDVAAFEPFYLKEFMTTQPKKVVV